MKRIWILLLVVTLCVSFAGCGEDVSPVGTQGTDTVPTDFWSVAVPLTVDILDQAADTEGGAGEVLGKVYSFRGVVTEITAEYALLEYRIFLSEDTLWVSSPDIVCGHLYLPGEELAQLQVDQFLEIAGKVDAISHPLFEDSGYTTTALEFREANVQQYYEVSGYLRYIVDWEERVCYFTEGDSRVDDLVHFNETVDLSAYRDLPSEGIPVTIRAKMILGNYYDATIIS